WVDRLQNDPILLPLLLKIRDRPRCLRKPRMHRRAVQRVDQAMCKLLIILVDLPSPDILGRGPHVVSGDTGALHHRQGDCQYEPGPGDDRSGRLHQPPSTPIAWPVTKAASSEARKEITAATSSGVPTPPPPLPSAR